MWTRLWSHCQLCSQSVHYAVSLRYMNICLLSMDWFLRAESSYSQKKTIQHLKSVHSHPLLVPAGIASSCGKPVDTITFTWALWSGANITITKLIYISLYVCTGYSFAPVEIYEDTKKKSVYEESTQFQKVKWSSLYLTRLLCFLFIDTCVNGAENLSAFCAQHQFLLDFYIYFFFFLL